MINFKKKGYFVEKELFGKNELLNIKDDIFNIFDNTNENPSFNFKRDSNKLDAIVSHTFYNDYEAFLGSIRICQNLISLINLSIDKKILSILKTLGLNKPVQSTPPMLMMNSSKLSRKESHYKTPPHQDWRSIQGSIDSVVVWIPLVDVNKEMGSLQIVPFSHKNGLRRTVKDEWFRKIKHPPTDDHFINVEMNEGDALFFSTFLIHKSGNIYTDKIRWSAQFRYNNLEDKTFIKNKYPNPYQIKINDKIINPEFFESIIEPK
ncbi:MAG: phytanoyl-CoA dioxygenase [Euryarchaeota archaeon]|nr:phytanoyl-CoA dioxygenase [Euryarchaeota archaeon]